MKSMTLIQKIGFAMILSLSLLNAVQTMAREKEEQIPLTTIDELRTAIEKVLEETKTPAVGLALVNKDGSVWIAGLGKADVEKNVEANENTMFRIGSVSKMFVALAVLKLTEEGRLSLQDKVQDLVPEIEFKNPWEDTNPILLEHLLEHTTGWDDFHLTENAHNDPTPVSLIDGLNYHPHSRTSRWIPGTRMSYCNSGPPVAAYIVEKITGQPFEDYIQSNFFRPMGMENMTYFASDEYKQFGATLYQKGKPQEYWNIIMRPSGSINASPKDMAKMVQFFIHRGMIDSVQLINQTSLKRMETPSTTTGAKAGLECGYGLNNYSSPYKSFVYRQHDGGVPGGLTGFSYLPGHNVGYAFMINSGSVEAFFRITKLVRDFQTKDFEINEIFTESELTNQHAAVSGYYMAINPRSQMLYFLERILNVQRIWCKEDSIFHKYLIRGEISKYLPTDGLRFKSAETGLINMIQVNDPLAGEVIHTDLHVLKRISVVEAFGQLIVGILWVLFMLSAIIFGMIWSVRYWRGKISGGANIRIRFWPLMACLFFLSFFLISVWNSNSLNFSKFGLVSLILMISTIGFAITSFWSVICIIKERNKPIKKRVYWHSAILSGLHLIVTCYFLWYGVIGFRTWA